MLVYCYDTAVPVSRHWYQFFKVLPHLGYQEQLPDSVNNPRKYCSRGEEHGMM